MLREKTKAPSFELEDQNGKLHKLSDYKGKKVVLYFYPKDNTPGCTVEACNFNDDLTKIKRKGAVVLGVSKDSVKSHEKFSTKFGLKFPILSDPEHKMLEKYMAWQKKSMYGRIYRGIARITYIIDEQGKILKAFPKVNTKEHSKEILGYL